MKITPEMIHQAYCIATPDAWHQDWSQIDQSALVRYTIMADYLNGQITNEMELLQSVIEMQQAEIEQLLGTHDQP